MKRRTEERGRGDSGSNKDKENERILRRRSM